jgi:hypothetical protein
MSLRLILIEQTIPPRLDFLLFALDKVRPQGNDTPVPEEMLVETRRLFADLRRVLAGCPVHLADPVGPLTRAQYRPFLIEAVEDLAIYKEEERQMELERRRNARKDNMLEKRGTSLSPLPFPDLR